MDKDITVILNGFRRPHRLEEQYNAVKSQSIAPKEIMLWQNFHPDTFDKFPKNVIDNCTSAICNKNLGVWMRFAFALQAKTNWVAIFDDDTIPGNKYFENVMNCMDKSPGIYGTRGVIFGKSGSYYDNQGIGWETSNPEITKVDIIGHAWFFHREWLKSYWLELPPPQYMFLAAGEDITLSYAAQKHFGVSTYVPPHPKENKDMWGSLKACEYGIGKEAASNNWIPSMNEYLQFVRRSGFKLINDAK